VREIILLGVAAHALERQDHDGWLVGQREGWRRALDDDFGRRRVGGGAGAPGPHRLGDVFQRLVAHVVIGNLGLAPDLAMRVVGDADATGIGDAFEPRGDVDAVAKDVVVVDDDVADMDADAELDPLGLGDVDIAQVHAALDLDRATDRIDGTAEFDQHAVAGGLDDATAIFGDFGIDESLSAGFETGEGAVLVDAHQTAVARNIGRENCRKPPLNPGASHFKTTHPRARRVHFSFSTY